MIHITIFRRILLAEILTEFDQPARRVPEQRTTANYSLYKYIHIYIYIYIYIYIKPFRALCHYNLVTGTNKQSYSNLNY